MRAIERGQASEEHHQHTRGVVGERLNEALTAGVMASNLAEVARLASAEDAGCGQRARGPMCTIFQGDGSVCE